MLQNLYINDNSFSFVLIGLMKLKRFARKHEYKVAFTKTNNYDNLECLAPNYGECK